jgi:DNA-binding transcriptional LysR family regulator
LVLCAGKGVLREKEYISDLKVLDQQPFFLMKQEHAVRNFCDSFFKKNGIRPEICNEFSSSVTCYRMAATGLGFAIVPYMVTQLASPGLDIDVFSLGKEAVTWDVNMYFRKEAYLGHPEQDMIHLAQKLFRHEMLFY